MPRDPAAAINCTDVGVPVEGCTINNSLYGYEPNIGVNAFFAAFFGLCLLLQLAFGIKYKTWTYMIALGLGCLGECIGYIGRIMLHNNVYDDLGFQIQICCLIICPAFVSGGIYLTLKHVVFKFGEEWSVLRAPWYTYIFITGDIFSLVLQGAGGGIAATADNGDSLQDVGTNLMIAGVIFQVVILGIFAALSGLYAFRTYQRRNQLSSEAMALFHSTKFRCFAGAIFAAYAGILIRCIYRIPELTGGWGNEIMRNEPEFIVLEGFMIVIAVGAMTIFHPGFCFPALGATFSRQQRAKSLATDSEHEMVDRA
ncbi:RTA1 like protein-domain-containing protein [Lophiotrema nucula]|uniref:RTA1 like protein-domain-containing protein n=1 Tax=Lophiotrema nucula TaxID=690887 RepID=A0A6A5ZWH1_9PLEO|nr:RTA1 like protein-domain-containing protein [Lophiotrema nucula]